MRRRRRRGCGATRPAIAAAHLHLLVPEALWRVDGAVVPVPPPSDADVTAVLHRVLRLAQRDFANADAPFPEDDFEDF